MFVGSTNDIIRAEVKGSLQYLKVVVYTLVIIAAVKSNIEKVYHLLFSAVTSTLRCFFTFQTFGSFLILIGLQSSLKESETFSFLKAAKKKSVLTMW